VPHQGRKSADEQLRWALACGATVESAAQKAGISARTAHRRLQDPKFRQSLRELKADIVQRSSSTLAAASGEAIKTLVGLLNPKETSAVRLGASRAIVQLGMRLREVTELEERIAALEQRIDGQSGTEN
jgi:hypothetical protein